MGLGIRVQSGVQYTVPEAKGAPKVLDGGVPMIVEETIRRGGIEVYTGVVPNAQDKIDDGDGGKDIW
jgi:hypothetical protein